MPFNVRGRAWLFIIKSAFLLFFYSSFPATTFEKCSRHDTDGRDRSFESLARGTMYSFEHPREQQWEKSPPPSSHPPTLSHSTITHELKQHGVPWECRWHGIEYRFRLFQKHEVLVPTSYFPPKFLIQHFIYACHRHVLEECSVPGAIWDCESREEDQTGDAPVLTVPSPVQGPSVLALLAWGPDDALIRWWSCAL